MIKTSLLVKKLDLEQNKNIIFKSLHLELKIGTINFIINEANLTNLFFKSILNLIDSNKKVYLFNNKIEDSFEEIGYYHEDVDIYKDLIIKQFFKLSKSYYKNNYDSRLDDLINLFHINVCDKIDSIDRSKYEIIKLIDALYHNPSLIILYEPYKYLSEYEIDILNNYLISLKNNGTTILIYTQKINNLFFKDNNYFIFNNYKLINIKELKNKKYIAIYNGNLNTKLKIVSVIQDYTNKLSFTGALEPLVKDLILSNVKLINIKVINNENII